MQPLRMLSCNIYILSLSQLILWCKHLAPLFSAPLIFLFTTLLMFLIRSVLQHLVSLNTVKQQVNSRMLHCNVYRLFILRHSLYSGASRVSLIPECRIMSILYRVTLFPRIL